MNRQLNSAAAALSLAAAVLSGPAPAGQQGDNGAEGEGRAAPSAEFHPAWMKDLVVYEIATKSFNSPNGPEQGTFRSVMEKLPYLQDLGVNGIWMSGDSLGDPHHFYNIWTQYACVRPDVLDPALGTRSDLRALTAEARKRGIRIFLDVITHGVMNSSSLIKEHPDWFKGGSWGMTDYDWKGNHPDLDAWWVQTFAGRVIEDGIDGFRLDCGMRRPDLWRRIKEKANAAGREFVIFTEGSQHTDDVADSSQSWIFLGLFDGRRTKGIRTGTAITDAGRYYTQDFFQHFAKWAGERKDNYMVPTMEISCHDNGWTGFPTNLNPYVVNGSRAYIGYAAMLAPIVPILYAGDEFDADYVPVPYHCGELFGKDRKTPGRWLYGSWIQWDQLKDARHREMFEDVKRMLEIRHRNAALIHGYVATERNRGILSVRLRDLHDGVPVPYVLFKDGKSVLVAGNPTSRDVDLLVRLPFEKMGRGNAEGVALRDVWNDGGAAVKPDARGWYRIHVPHDRVARGGLAVYEF